MAAQKPDTETTNKICVCANKGMPLSTAAERCGLSRQLIYEWKRWGDKALSEGRTNAYTDFATKVNQAQAMFEQTALEAIQKAGQDAFTTDANGNEHLIRNGQWTALAFLLERTRPGKYGQKVNVEVKQAKEEFLDIVEKHLNQHVKGVLARKILQGILEDLMELDRRREAGETAGG